MTRIALLLAAFLGIASIAPLHGEELNYNVVNLQAEASRRVANDTMVALMSASAEADSSAAAATRVNTDMRWALEAVPESEAIDHRTVSYRTWPLYHDQVITGWSASQQIRFASADIEALTQLLGTLQEKLKLETMQFEISPELRRQVVNELITGALEAFGTKAQLVRTALGAKDYRMLAISLEENGPPAPYARGLQLEAVRADRVGPPAVEAGDSEIIVRAVGSIQLVF